MKHILRKLAEKDLEDIWLHTLNHWDIDHITMGLQSRDEGMGEVGRGIGHGKVINTTVLYKGKMTQNLNIIINVYNR